MLQQKFTVQVTTLPHCDDITRFDGTTVWCTQWTPSVCRGVFVTGNTSTTSGLTVTLSVDQSRDYVALRYDVLNELPLCAGVCLWRGTPPRPLASRWPWAGTRAATVKYYGMMYSMNSLCVQGRVCDGEHLHDLWPHGDPEQGPDHLLCSTTV